LLDVSFRLTAARDHNVTAERPTVNRVVASLRRVSVINIPLRACNKNGEETMAQSKRLSDLRRRHAFRATEDPATAFQTVDAEWKGAE
jgi:hypothetical protein